MYFENFIEFIKYEKSDRKLLRVLFLCNRKTRIFFDAATFSVFPLFCMDLFSRKRTKENIYSISDGTPFTKDVKTRFRRASNILHIVYYNRSIIHLYVDSYLMSINTKTDFHEILNLGP